MDGLPFWHIDINPADYRTHDAFIADTQDIYGNLSYLELYEIYQLRGQELFDILRIIWDTETMNFTLSMIIKIQRAEKAKEAA